MNSISYTNRKNAANKLSEVSKLHEQARTDFENASIDYYKNLAFFLRSDATGEENAKPAIHFARLMTSDPEEQHAIATSIGVCGCVAQEDFRMLHSGCANRVSNGYVAGFLSPLRRKQINKVIRWAEVDENGNVIGDIHQREEPMYVYYWAK